MKIALPILLVGLIVGLLVSIFQAVTQIQEQTLSFIPKIARPRRRPRRRRPVDARPAARPGPRSSTARSRRWWADEPRATSLAQFGEQQTAGFILVLARVSPLFVLAPLFSSKMLPARARGIVAVGARRRHHADRLAAGAASTIPLDLLPLAGLVLKELLVGLAFAFSLAACSPPSRWPAAFSTR